MAMTREQLEQYERMCHAMFQSTNPQERQHAQATVTRETQSTDFIPKCQFIFDNCQSHYGLLVAAKALTQLVRFPASRLRRALLTWLG